MEMEWEVVALSWIIKAGGGKALAGVGLILYRGSDDEYCRRVSIRMCVPVDVSCEESSHLTQWVEVFGGGVSSLKPSFFRRESRWRRADKYYTEFVLPQPKKHILGDELLHRFYPQDAKHAFFFERDQIFF
jgi:hypothetical protein